MTSQAPFDACDSLAALLARIIADEPPRPRTLNPTLPRDLETICLKAMARAPDDRFTTAQEFADELWRWLQDEPLTIRPPTLLQRLRRWARWHRPLARMAAAAVLLLVVVSATLGGLAWDQSEKRHRAEQVRIQAEADTETARVRQRIEVEKRAEIEVWSLLNAAWQLARRPTQGRRREAQAILAQVAGPRRRLRDAEVIEGVDLSVRSVYAASLGVPDLEVGDRMELPGVFYAAWPAALCRDGDAVVIGTHLGPIRWVRGEPPRLPRGLDPNKPRPRLIFRPDGKFLVLAPATGSLELWDGQAAACLHRMEPNENVPFLALRFAGDGDELWACRADGQVRSWGSASGRPGMAWSIEVSEDHPLTAACFDTDATRLAVGQDDGSVRLFRRGNSKCLLRLRTARFAVSSLAWSPDNRLLAAGAEDGSVLVWDGEGVPWLQLPGSPDRVSVLQFTPDGRWLLVGGRNGGMKMWDTHTGEPLLTGLHLPGAFAPDGRSFAGASAKDVAFCTLLPPQEGLYHLRADRVTVQQLAWSRSNRHLASLDSRFEVCVWDTSRGLALTSFAAPLGTFSPSNAAIALSGDGGLLGYANGGDNNRFLILDVATGGALGPVRELPRSFERLTWANGEFLLVGEEEGDANQRNCAHRRAHFPAPPSTRRSAGSPPSRTR